MNPTKYKVIIDTTGMSLEEIPEMLEQIKKSFIKGYVNGGSWQGTNKNGYSFETIEV